MRRLKHGGNLAVPGNLIAYNPSNCEERAFLTPIPTVLRFRSWLVGDPTADLSKLSTA